MPKAYIFVISLILPSFFILPSDTAAIEPLRYGKIIGMTSEGFAAEYGTLEQEEYFKCILANLSCLSVGGQYNEAIPSPASDGQHYFYNADKTKIVVGTKVYGLNGQRWIEQQALPIEFAPQRAYFSDDGSRLIVSGVPIGKSRTVTSVIDLVTNSVLVTRTMSLPTSFLTISPNGRYFAYFEAARAGNKNTRAFVLYDLDRGRSYRSTQKIAYWDLISEAALLFAFSPDSKTLAYLDDRNGYPTPYIVDLAKLSGTSFRGTQIITQKYTTGPFIFADNQTLYLVANREHPLDWKLYKYSLANKTIQAVADNASYAHRLRRTSDDRIIFFQMKNNSSVPVVYDPLANQIRSFRNLEGNNTAAPVTRETHLINGLGAALLKPTPANPAPARPLLVWLHGGPFRQTSLAYHPWRSYAVYDWMLDEAVQSGAVVLKLDYRGSYGYGRPFSESIRNTVGKGDVNDVLKAIEYVKARQPVSEVYVIGNSYGGYLALRSLAAAPKTITGAISINGVTDWKTLLANLRTSIFNIHFGGAPNKKNTSLYSQASVLSRISSLTDQNKILILQAEADMTIPRSQATLLYDALIAKQKNVTLKMYPDEDHVFKKESSLEDICQNVLSFASLSLQNRCDFR